MIGTHALMHMVTRDQIGKTKQKVYMQTKINGGSIFWDKQPYILKSNGAQNTYVICPKPLTTIEPLYDQSSNYLLHL